MGCWRSGPSGIGQFVYRLAYPEEACVLPPWKTSKRYGPADSTVLERRIHLAQEPRVETYRPSFTFSLSVFFTEGTTSND